MKRGLYHSMPHQLTDRYQILPIVSGTGIIEPDLVAGIHNDQRDSDTVPYPVFSGLHLSDVAYDTLWKYCLSSGLLQPYTALRKSGHPVKHVPLIPARANKPSFFQNQCPPMQSLLSRPL